MKGHFALVIIMIITAFSFSFVMSYYRFNIYEKAACWAILGVAGFLTGKHAIK